MAVAGIRSKLTVNKQRSHRFDMERFNLKKLNEVEGKVWRSDLQVWKIWTLVVLGRLLERQTLQPKRV
jgi:hypothetical protein